MLSTILFLSGLLLQGFVLVDCHARKRWRSLSLLACWLVIGALSLFAWIRPAWADDRLVSFDPDQLSDQPGVVVSRRTEGSATVTVWSRNGVSVERRVDGFKTTVVANDNTPKGAVLCQRGIEVWARASLEICPGPSSALRLDLDQNIADIDAFVVSNSLTPISLDELRTREQQAYADARLKALRSPSETARLCTEGYDGKVISYFNTMTHDERRTLVKDLLATPRWAVLNPCI